MLISLAEDAAEKMLRDGTASSQIIALYAKQGTRAAKLERETAELQKELIAAKRDSIRQGQKIEQLFELAIKAMKHYKGEDDEDGQDVL